MTNTPLNPDALEAAAKSLDSNFNTYQYPVMAAMFRDYAETAVTAYLTAAQPVVNSLIGLPNNTAIEDSAGDVGVVMNSAVHYPETNPMGIDYVSKKYGPFTIRYAPEVPGA